jgi:amylovoran biosynthesis glycosyltransferase AmsE
MFSVLMSIYERERPEYFREALDSLGMRELRADEVVLVIDWSISHQFEELIEGFRKKLNIWPVDLAVNSGLGVALNEGLKACSHELAARMDSVDPALPNRFARQC